MHVPQSSVKHLGFELTDKLTPSYQEAEASYQEDIIVAGISRNNGVSALDPQFWTRGQMSV